ncbi:hypothetical protein KFL_000580190 [Klebsormidium nitens]|uniref:Uncharacterized protein n=1 Tax=Klebsormidium nitens TaxID=105231 RepID=A0A1Y1HPR7_KLENI|nr:hypothetical protein KFL_000580190 [Klebsormidium nitens]|eukprot:GAQ80625.1 hypothetical protein KFL_000580190 [Klebsormidium nitens]
MEAKSSLIGLFGLLCLVLQSAEVFATALGEDSGSVDPMTELRFRGETTAVAHRKLMQTASPTQALGAVASMCPPTDLMSKPLTRVICYYVVTTGGVESSARADCTYNATGALLKPSIIPAVSCPVMVVPNSCPASVQQNVASVVRLTCPVINSTSNPLTRFACLYGVQQSVPASFNTTYADCFYNTTGALVQSQVDDPNILSCPGGL